MTKTFKPVTVPADTMDLVVTPGIVHVASGPAPTDPLVGIDGVRISMHDNRNPQYEHLGTIYLTDDAALEFAAAVGAAAAATAIDVDTKSLITPGATPSVSGHAGHGTVIPGTVASAEVDDDGNPVPVTDPEPAPVPVLPDVSGMNKGDAIRALAAVSTDVDWLVAQTGATSAYVERVLRERSS